MAADVMQLSLFSILIIFFFRKYCLFFRWIVGEMAGVINKHNEGFSKRKYSNLSYPKDNRLPNCFADFSNIYVRPWDLVWIISQIEVY
jgi:hypothetical protein